MTVAAAVVVIVLVALGGTYYVAVYNKPNQGYSSERIVIQIGGAFYNSSDPDNLNGLNAPAAYYPDSFNVTEGNHISLVITNTDSNMTHGLAVASFSLDTGQMQPNATVTLSFVATPVGSIVFSEPAADCGGGNCDAGSDLNGTITVTG